MCWLQIRVVSVGIEVRLLLLLHRLLLPLLILLLLLLLRLHRLLRLRLLLLLLLLQRLLRPRLRLVMQWQWRACLGNLLLLQGVQARLILLRRILQLSHATGAVADGGVQSSPGSQRAGEQ